MLFHYLCTLHNVIFFLCDIENCICVLSVVQLMCLNDKADWIVISWESVVVLFDIVGLSGFRIRHDTLLARVCAMDDPIGH